MIVGVFKCIYYKKNTNAIYINEYLLVYIQAGANVAMKDNAGWTALRFASDRGYKAIADALLNAGARVDWGLQAFLYIYIL